MEADAFGRYLTSLNLQVPHLAKILEFEEATLATLTDDQPKIVQFPVEPLPLLRALVEGRLPTEAGQAGDFEIELTADRHTTASGVDLQAVSGSFPFH